MHEKTPEIIEKSLKQAGLSFYRPQPVIPAYLATTALGGHFLTSPWSLYPITKQHSAGLFKYKELTYQFLRKNECRAVETHFVHDISFKNLSSFFGLPFVIKQNDGSGSKNVFVIKDEDAFADISDRLESVGQLCVQPFIEMSEYRVFIIRGEIKFVYKKKFVSGDHVDRYADVLDDTFAPLFSDFPEYLSYLAKNLYEKTSAEVIGADIFLERPMTESQEPVVLELNHNPGLAVMYEYGYEAEMIEILSSTYKAI